MGSSALSDGGTPTSAVWSTRSSVQICGAPGTDTPGCHNFWAVPESLPKIDFVLLRTPPRICQFLLTKILYTARLNHINKQRDIFFHE